MNSVKPRRNNRPALAGVGLLAVTLLLAGCASIRGTVPDAEIVPQVDCADTSSAGRIPDGFEPVEAILCDDFGTAGDEDGVWSGPATRHLAGDLAPLIDALNQPDDPRWLGPCTAHMAIVPHLWLADAAGRAVHVTYPIDGCGQPKTETVNAAIALLSVTSGSVDPQELTESNAAVEAGCSTRWTPLRLAGPGELPNVLPPVDQLDGMRLCHYAAEANPEPQTNPVDVVGLPIRGTFTSGSTLNADDGRTVLAAAGYEVMPLIGCIRPATAFVVAHPLVGGQDTGGTITIELDGCQRLFGTSGFTLVSEEFLALVQPQ